MKTLEKKLLTAALLGVLAAVAVEVAGPGATRAGAGTSVGRAARSSASTPKPGETVSRGNADTKRTSAPGPASAVRPSAPKSAAPARRDAQLARLPNPGFRPPSPPPLPRQQFRPRLPPVTPLPRPLPQDPGGLIQRQQARRLKQQQDRADFLDNNLLRNPLRGPPASLPQRTGPTIGPADPNTPRVLRELGPHPLLQGNRVEVIDRDGRTRVIVVPRE